MSPEEYIKLQPENRQSFMLALHMIILANDKSVKAIVEPMMGKEMIIYKERGYMKYALASVKNYMSLHCMPIYMNTSLHQKYNALLPGAKIQKGCINFKSAEEMPVNIAGNLITDCNAISIAVMMEKRKKK